MTMSLIHDKFFSFLQASLVGFPAPSHHPSQTSRWVIFSNPASSMFREQMSIRLSRDGCSTWSVPWTIHSNNSAYSDLTYFETEAKGNKPVKRTQNFGMVYEAGYQSAYDAIYFKMFNLEAILSGIQNSTNSFTHKLQSPEKKLRTPPKWKHPFSVWEARRAAEGFDGILNSLSIRRTAEMMHEAWMIPFSIFD